MANFKDVEGSNIEFRVDTNIKIEIIELFIFLFEERIDFLITNFLNFFEDNFKRNQVKNNSWIEDYILTLIPPLLSTGITSIDIKYHTDNFFDILNVVEGVIQNKPKNRKFINYSEEEEMPDLNSLLAKKMDGSLKSEVNHPL